MPIEMQHNLFPSHPKSETVLLDVRAQSSTVRVRGFEDRVEVVHGGEHEESAERLARVVKVVALQRLPDNTPHDTPSQTQHDGTACQRHVSRGSESTAPDSESPMHCVRQYVRCCFDDTSRCSFKLSVALDATQAVVPASAVYPPHHSHIPVPTQPYPLSRSLSCSSFRSTVQTPFSLFLLHPSIKLAHTSWIDSGSSLHSLTPSTPKMVTNAAIGAAKVVSSRCPITGRKAPILRTARIHVVPVLVIVRARE